MPEEAPDRILVIQLRRLGDVLVTTPSVEALRMAYPRAEIDFLVEPPGDQLLEGNSHLSRVLLYDAKHPLAEIRKARARGYDWVIDFLGTPRSAVLTALSGARVKAGPSHVFHRWAYNRKFPAPGGDQYTALLKLEFLRAAFAVAPPSPVRLSFPIPEEARHRAEAALGELGIAPGELVLGVMPFSRRATRRWPREYVARLLVEFHRRLPAKSLLFWGGREERADALWIQEQAGPAVRLVPDTRDLKLIGALLTRCAAALACDNGPKHMAMALEIPTLVVHGATRPANWNPPGDPRFQVVRRDELFCIGCEQNECPFNLECMTGLTPERVLKRLFDAFDSLRAGRGART